MPSFEFYDEKASKIIYKKYYQNGTKCKIASYNSKNNTQTLTTQDLKSLKNNNLILDEN